MRPYEVAVIFDATLDETVFRETTDKIGDRIQYEENNYECAKGADALVLVTEWHEFRRPSFDRLKTLLKQPVIFDGRNIWSPAELRARIQEGSKVAPIFGY